MKLLFDQNISSKEIGLFEVTKLRVIKWGLYAEYIERHQLQDKSLSFNLWISETL